MTLLTIIRHDMTPAVTSLGSAAFGTLTTDVALQRLAWTLAINVSLCAIIRYIYRFYKWWKERKIQLKPDYDEDDD